MAEFLESARTHTPELEILVRLVLAASFGAIIGFDREVRDRNAGLRTHMMTAVAASVFTILTFEIFHEIRKIEPGPAADPIRVIEAVTAGVAFLAAGAIIQSRGRVKGLTTGAGMWLAGAIGVACGAGFYSIATIATILAIVILVVLGWLERRLLSRHKGEPARTRQDPDV